MGWAVTTDPLKFTEACDFFLKRVVLTEEQALRLGTDAGRRAFWIGRGLQLTQIQRVFDSLNAAIESGEPFSEWKKRVAGQLRDDAHAETVFRNAAQRSLNAGRYRQMRDAQKWRPYWMYDSVLDSRTTDICRTLDGTVRAADDPYWNTRIPPLHHRCRAGIRSLRKSEGEKRVTNVPPTVSPAPGFGAAPDADPDWKPDPGKHDPALIAELDKKSKKERKPRPKPAKPPQQHSPKYWEGVYEKPTKHAKEGYGEAAPCLGYGRAMLERGLDRTPADVLEELTRLQKAGHPLLRDLDLTMIEGLEQKPFRTFAFAHSNQWKARIALSEHTRTIKAVEFELDARHLPATRGAARFYDLSLDEKVRRPDRAIPIAVDGRRAGYSPRFKRINLHNSQDVGTATHELAHAIEDVDARALARSKAFLAARTKGELRKSLRKLTGKNYEEWEEAWEDHFLDPYFGKDYGALGATELTSLGYELLAGGNAGNMTLRDMVGKDEGELLYFLLGQLAGR